MPKRRVTTSRQRAASIRNLVKARAARRKVGNRGRADAAYARAANAPSVSARQKSQRKGMAFEAHAVGRFAPHGKPRKGGAPNPTARRTGSGTPTRGGVGAPNSMTIKQTRVKATADKIKRRQGRSTDLTPSQTRAAAVAAKIRARKQGR